MNKINLDFEREKNDFKWNLIDLIYNILFLVIFIIITCLNKYYKNSKYLDPTEFEIIIKEKNQEIYRLEDRIRYLENNNKNKNINNNNLLTIANNDTERKELKETSESKNIIKMEKQKKIDELTSIIESKEKQIDETNKKIKILENCIPFEIREGEKLMCVIFISSIDKRIHCPFICTNKQMFNVLENSLYEKFPEYKNNNNDFISEEKIIDRNKTLEENNLKDGAIIDMNIKELKK